MKSLLIAVLALVEGSAKMATSGAPEEKMQFDAANVKVPEDAPLEGREPSHSQLNPPQEEAGAGGATSSQVPGGGDSVVAKMAEISENMMTMAILLKNIQEQQSKQKSTMEITDAAWQTVSSMSKAVEALKSSAGPETKKTCYPQ